MKYITDADAAAKYQPIGNYLTSHQSLDGYVNAINVSGSGNAVTSITKSGKTLAIVKGATFLTSHQSLAGYAKTSQIPTKVSQLTNDSGFLTSHQSLAAYIKTVDADKKYLGKTEKAASASTADNAARVNGHTVNADVPENAKFTDTEYIIPTLPSAPTSRTLTYTNNGVDHLYRVGYMCRVKDSSAEHGYKFYQLYNIIGTSTGIKAVWGEISGGDYNETVTVTLKSTVSSSDSKLNGAVVTVNNTMSGETQTQTWNGTPLVFKIPSVNTYTVSVSILTSYITPESQSYTAGIDTNRSVLMTYIKLPLGIYIYDTDQNFTLSENWNTANNSKAVGVYVGTENSHFVIAPMTTVFDPKYNWGDSVQVSEIVTSTNKENAKKDYAGELNTDKIIAQLGTGHAPAAEYCRNYTFKNGKKGYLWSLGEARDAYNNMQKINNAFIAIGYKKIASNSNYYWTSTQANRDDAWVLYLRGSIIETDSVNKMSEYYARPVFSF